MSKIKKYHLVLLDRDGVINNERGRPVLSVADFELLPGVGEAIKKLNQAEFKVAVVTNQACVDRGDLSREELQKIHDYMIQLINQEDAHIDRIYACTDKEVEPNNRRKPAPGMLLEAMKDFGISSDQAMMVGDDLRDLQAAKSAGCDGILVRTGKGLKTEHNPHLKDCSPLKICEDLSEVVDFLCG